MAVKRPERRRGKGGTSLPMRCFLPCFSSWRRLPSAVNSQKGASSASMTGIRDEHIGDDLCIDFLLALSGVLQIDRNFGRKCDNKSSLTNKMNFQCREMDDAADAGMNTVQMVSAGW